MKWIGLTGGMGSGKSSVTALLRARGLPVADADELARQVVEPGTTGLLAVVQAFGPGIIDPAGRLDRAKLAGQVFGNPGQLARLELILHPMIQAEVLKFKSQAAAAGHAMAFYDVPLLFEKNLQQQFDATLVIWCTEEQQIERSMARDGSNRSEVERRLQSQLAMSEKKTRADVLIDNTGSADSLDLKVDQALQELTKLQK